MGFINQFITFGGHHLVERVSLAMPGLGFQFFCFATLVAFWFCCDGFKISGMFLSLENHTRHHIRSAAFINAKIKIERQKILLKPNKKMQNRKTLKKRFLLLAVFIFWNSTPHNISKSRHPLWHHGIGRMQSQGKQVPVGYTIPLGCCTWSYSWCD